MFSSTASYAQPVRSDRILQSAFEFACHAPASAKGIRLRAVFRSLAHCGRRIASIFERRRRSMVGERPDSRASRAASRSMPMSASACRNASCPNSSRAMSGSRSTVLRGRTTMHGTQSWSRASSRLGLLAAHDRDERRCRRRQGPEGVCRLEKDSAVSLLGWYVRMAKNAGKEGDGFPRGVGRDVQRLAAGFGQPLLEMGKVNLNGWSENLVRHQRVAGNCANRPRIDRASDSLAWEARVDPRARFARQ